MNDSVKEVQDYLETKGFKVSETTIIDMAVDLTRSFSAGNWAFVCEYLRRKAKAEEKKK